MTNDSPQVLVSCVQGRLQIGAASNFWSPKKLSVDTLTVLSNKTAPAYNFRVPRS